MLRLAARDVVAPDTSEIVTATDWAVAVPLLATVSCSGVVAPAWTVALPSLNELGTMSALGIGAGAGAGAGGETTLETVNLPCTTCIVPATSTEAVITWLPFGTVRVSNG